MAEKMTSVTDEADERKSNKSVDVFVNDTPPNQEVKTDSVSGRESGNYYKRLKVFNSVLHSKHHRPTDLSSSRRPSRSLSPAVLGSSYKSSSKKPLFKFQIPSIRFDSNSHSNVSSDTRSLPKYSYDQSRSNSIFSFSNNSEIISNNNNNDNNRHNFSEDDILDFNEHLHHRRCSVSHSRKLRDVFNSRKNRSQNQINFNKQKHNSQKTTDSTNFLSVSTAGVGIQSACSRSLNNLTPTTSFFSSKQPRSKQKRQRGRNKNSSFCSNQNFSDKESISCSSPIPYSPSKYSVFGSQKIRKEAFSSVMDGSMNNSNDRDFELLYDKFFKFDKKDAQFGRKRTVGKGTAREPEHLR